MNVFPSIPAMPGRQCDPRRVEYEFVTRQGIPQLAPAALLIPVDVDAALPVRRRHHVADGQYLEIFLQQRMNGNGAPHHHRCFDLLLHKLEPFELHLTAPDVQRRDDLVIRRGRGMRHVGLTKRLLDFAPEILIVYVNHRALSQRRQRLVR